MRLQFVFFLLERGEKKEWRWCFEGGGGCACVDGCSGVGAVREVWCRMTSRYRGVSWNKKNHAWQARIRSGGVGFLTAMRGNLRRGIE